MIRMCLFTNGLRVLSKHVSLHSLLAMTIDRFIATHGLSKPPRQARGTRALQPEQPEGESDEWQHERDCPALLHPTGRWLGRVRRSHRLIDAPTHLSCQCAEIDRARS